MTGIHVNEGSLNGSHISCPSIDEFRNQIYSTIYSLIFVVGLAGNSFALYILVKTYKQRTPFNIYMLNLAISDMLFVCTLPLRVSYYSSKGMWVFGSFMCRVTSYAFYVNLYCSIYFMTAMSFTRFVAIVFPVQNLNLVNIKKAKITCVVIWLFIMLTSMPFLLKGSHVAGNKTKCFEPPKTIQGKGTILILNYVSLILGFVIPFLIILICYAFIVKSLMKTTAAINKRKASRRKAIHLIIIVLTAFLVSFMPYHIQRTVHLHSLNQPGDNCKEIVYKQKSVVVTLCLAASNTCLDPLLYFFSGENFRRRLASSFRRKSSVSSNQVSHKRSIVRLMGQEKTDDDPNTSNQNN